MVRHLSTDPVLPAELLTDDWPGQALRDAYGDYQVELLDLIHSIPSGGQIVPSSGDLATG